MHANERGRVHTRRARAHARAYVSVGTRMQAKGWVQACKHECGCMHASAQARAWVCARKRRHRLCMQAQVWVCACEHGRGCMHVSGEHANGQTDMQAGE